MILKFKNKYLIALDKLIKNGDEVGLIESILLDPTEALGLILEIINLGVKYTKDIEILDGEGNNITRAELIWGGKGVDKTVHAKALIQRWYKIQIAVTYKNIPVCVVKPGGTKKEIPKEEKAAGWTAPEEVPKKEEVPELTDIVKSWNVYDKMAKGRQLTGIKPPVDSENMPAVPKPPPNRLIVSEPWVGTCDKCGSSKKTKWFFFDTDSCIQPECENYWDKK